MSFLADGGRRPADGTSKKEDGIEEEESARRALTLSEMGGMLPIDNSSTPRFASSHVPLKFGSTNSTFMAPSFVSGSGPASATTTSSSSSSSTSTVRSPETVEPKVQPAYDMTTTPSSATTAETPVAASTFSAPRTRSPSVSSVSSLRSRSPFNNLPPLSIPPSSAPLPIPLAKPCRSCGYPPPGSYVFDPDLPPNVLASSRRAFSIDSSMQTDPVPELEAKVEPRATPVLPLEPHQHVSFAELQVTVGVLQRDLGTMRAKLLHLVEENKQQKRKIETGGLEVGKEELREFRRWKKAKQRGRGEAEVEEGRWRARTHALVEQRGRLMRLMEDMGGEIKQEEWRLLEEVLEEEGEDEEGEEADDEADDEVE